MSLTYPHRCNAGGPDLSVRAVLGPPRAGEVGSSSMTTGEPEFRALYDEHAPGQNAAGGHNAPDLLDGPRGIRQVLNDMLDNDHIE